MPRHTTEVMMHEELAETVAELIEAEELTMKMLMPEHVAHEAWHRWEERLKMAQRQQRISAAALQGNLLLKPWYM